MPSMKTIIAFGIAGLLLLQATGLDVFIAPQDCERSCATDGQDGVCAPMCSDCYCCPTLRTCLQPEGTLLLAFDGVIASLAETERAPQKATASDIFHVPKTLLA